MKRISIALAMAALAVLSTLAQSSGTPQNVLPDGETQVYGQLRYDTRLRTYGLTGFTTDAPNGYTLIRDYGMVAGQTPILTAGTFVGDKYYAYETILYANTLMPEAIVVVNTETGEYEVARRLEQADGTPLILDEMTYDPKTERLFGMHYDTDAGYTHLYEIDPTTLELSHIGTLDKAFYTLSADNGTLYGLVDGGLFSSATLYSLDENLITDAAGTLSPQKIGTTGVKLGQYSQSMEFDKTTHRLWWMAQANDENAYLVELDPMTADVLSKTNVSGSPQVLALGIPYQYAADGAPSYVRNLTAAAGSNGQLSATLSWTTPTTDYRNHALTSLSGVKIYRNNTLLATLDETAMGQHQTYNDQPTADGTYTYKVVPYNEEGDGVGKERRLFVGEDMPGKPQNISLTAVGSKATLTWDAPATGANGGFFQTSSLRYEIVRQPDGKTIAAGLTSNSLTDEVTEHKGYSYAVTAINDKGRGATGTSRTLAFGPNNEIPFTSPLSTQSDFNRWTTLDGNNDGNSWTFNPNTLTTTYDRNEQEADDWLISPAFTFDASKRYQLRYTYSTANWVDPNTYEPVMERMKVWFGKEPSKAGLTTLIKDLDEFHTASYTYLYGKDVFQPAVSGTAYVAFQACSDAEKGQIYIKDVSLREYSSTDLSVRYMTGSSLVNARVSQTYTVTVGNEGCATVSDYKVQLVDVATDKVLGESKGKNVNAEETVDVPVTWIPEKEGMLKVVARVVLTGDTYPADNELAEPVEVKVNAADADRWITLNTDDSYGWRMPFWLYDSYSCVQSIFYEKELQKKDIAITGLRFVYDSKLSQPLTFPVRISLKETELETLKPFGSNATLEADGFTTVFDGNVTVEKSGTSQELIVMLSTPYIYKGGNLNMMFETMPGANTYNGSAHPDWHFCEPEDASRSAYYSGNSETPASDEIYASDFTPYVSISYTDQSGSGIINPGTGNFRIRQDGDWLLLSQVCEEVSLMNVAGRVMLHDNHVERLNTGQLSKGIYILRATINGRTINRKITLK